jgi:hypothetical protein
MTSTTGRMYGVHARMKDIELAAAGGLVVGALTDPMVISLAGFQNRMRMISVSPEASAAMMSVRYGPMKFETKTVQCEADAAKHRGADGHGAAPPRQRRPDTSESRGRSAVTGVRPPRSTT